MNLISFVPTTGRKPALAPNTIESMFNEFFNHDFPVSFRNGQVQNSPAVNVAETQNAYRLEVAAPGLVKEDFEVKLDKELLTITAKKAESTEENKDEKYTRREFSYLEFKRSFHLPETVDATNIKASYENGVLHVTLEKKPEAKPQPARVIEIG